ncbi:hypothetical protein [Aliirhizobium cellulosilyticum]|uniref:Uncharacterized protein n=1 Tax=Aliirhizobium cellulosilyticum TaxID=393664 RepID=A0A7W6XA96_9HYPH|nr:hypothetical protein [Rhizobium cellulosilyticum]MBB4349356.1 hypothetical protein [Rhizobium cellulosilyticum]MBB4412422.1 hypothetical protein [Rhizobium cellulosilyticum]MBB4447054.1 hypothetical protein [Rhizobium cellulosilyticum]
MNRVIKLAAAAAIASLSYAGISYADSLEMNWAPELEKTLTTFNAPFNIEYTDDYNTGGGDDTNPDAVALPANEVPKLQAAIESNKSLSRRLVRRGVILDDVVNAQQAADGSVTFWIR